jgi:hypothetical protein
MSISAIGAALRSWPVCLMLESPINPLPALDSLRILLHFGILAGGESRSRWTTASRIEYVTVTAKVNALD